MAKLTLSVDERIVKRAKRFAEKRGTSVSQLVQQFLDLLSRPPRPRDGAEDTPVLKELRGLLKKGKREDYREHLAAKYR